jgi:hypothetical protein
MYGQTDCALLERQFGRIRKIVLTRFVALGDRSRFLVCFGRTTWARSPLSIELGPALLTWVAGGEPEAAAADDGLWDGWGRVLGAGVEAEATV